MNAMMNSLQKKKIISFLKKSNAKNIRLLKYINCTNIHNKIVKI